jgi:hypothetical protein
MVIRVPAPILGRGHPNTTRLVLLHARWLAISLFWRARALVRGSRVPPGALKPGDGIRGNQCRVLDAMPTLGPVLKIASDDMPTTYVVGLARGRRLLAEHEHDLRGLTVDLKSLFPRRRRARDGRRGAQDLPSPAPPGAAVGAA